MAPTSSSHLEHSTKTPCSSGIESLWVFSCLGYACTRSSVEEESDQFSTGIKLNVPDTVIFESGSPKFWLCTHDGKLTRRDLYQHLASYGDDGASQKHLKESLNDECISHAVEGMQSFWHRANSKATANSCIPACVVWYVDGERETLAICHLKTLSENPAWRNQLAALQGFIVPQHVKYGIYRASEDTLFGAVGSIRGGATRVGLNMLTRAIAKCIMGSYAVTSSVIAAGPTLPTTGSSLFGQIGQGTLLEFMRAIYLIDDQGVLWFSYADVVQMRPSLARNEPGSSIEHVTKSVSDATWLVATELRDLIKQANSSGVLLAECFSHFDCRSCGWVDALMLQHGLGELGIGVSAEVADALVVVLGNGASVFGIRDLASFCTQHGTSGANLHRKSSSPFAMPLANRSDSLHVADSTERASKVSERLPDGNAHEASLIGGNNKLSALINSSSSNGNRRMKWNFPRRKQLKQRGLRETEYSIQEDSLSLVSLEVTNAGERISRPPDDASTQRDISQTHRWDELPFWARESSRRALRQLMGHHTRFLKRRRLKNSMPAMDIVNREGLVVSCDEEVDDDASNAKLSTLAVSLSSRIQADHGSLGPLTTRVGYPLQEKLQHGLRLNISRGDGKIHVGDGNIMSYRWVKRAATKPTHGGTVLEATKALSKCRESMGLHVMRKGEFLMIVLPDLLMTLDAMESRLGGILEQNPQGRLLLVGSLGLPETQWNEEDTIDAQLQSRGLRNLLLELFQREDLNIDSHLCVVLMGLGCGATTLLHFAATHLLDSKFAWLRDSTRFLVVINPFPLTPRNSKETQQVKRSLETLRRVLERGNHHEQVQALATAFFSDEFISQHGRTSILHEFWSHRLGLELPKATRSSSAPTARGAESGRDNRPGTMNISRRTPLGEGGILQCLNGILHGFTFGPLCKNINLPIVLIASTNDVLDSSATTEHFPISVDAEKVDSFFELMNGQKRNRVLVCPVSAGREILQEAPIRTLQILIDAIQAAQTRSFVAGKNGKYPAEDPATEVVLQIDETDYIECETPNVLRPDSPESGDERKGGATPDIPGAVDTFHQKETRENNKQTDEIPDVLIEYPPAPGSNATTKKSRREREFEMRKERMAERRTKTERLRQQEQRTRLKKAKQETVERVDQQRELVVMRREDDRSRAVERYTRDVEAWVLRVAEAKDRALELTAARDSNEKKVAEDRVARDRAAKHFLRTQLFQQRKQNMLEKVEVDSNTMAGFIAKHTEVEQAYIVCEKLMEQLLSVRRGIVNTKRMELLRREQLTTFETQYRKLESELGEAERLQRTYTRRGTAAGVLGGISLQESKDLEVALAKQQVQLSSYQSMLKERQEVLGMVVSHLQTLKIALHGKQDEIRTCIYEIKKAAASLKRKAGQKRASNHNIIALRASLDSKQVKIMTRSKRLEHELSRLQAHTGLLFDTDVWQQGVMQRMAADKLGECLQEELDTTRISSQDNEQHMKRMDETLAVDVGVGQEIDLKSQILMQVVQTTEDKLNRVMSKTIAQELQASLNAEEEGKPFDATTMLKWEEGNVADKIRRKPSHERSAEEKHWVALDILVNRPLYDSLSPVELEELQLNDEYKTELRAEDVTRILGLPREIQLSLPHLSSPAEIEAHRLLVTYTHEQGDADFTKVGEDGQDMHMSDVVYSHGCSGGGEGLCRVESSAPKQKKRKLVLFETISDVGIQERYCVSHGEPVVRIAERRIYSSTTGLLKPQESGIHQFSIVDMDPVYSTDLKVIISFTGCMDTRGFSRGRVSAVLLRTSAREGSIEMSTKEYIGFGPHARQNLNVGDQFHQTPGTIVIQHHPKTIPIDRGSFKVEVKAVSLTEYSVAVFAGQGELCASLIDKRLEEGRHLKARLKELDSELNDTWASVRLRERQYRVCKTLIKEAEAECERCQDAIDDMCKKLQGDLVSCTSAAKEGDLEADTESSTNSRQLHSPWNMESGSRPSRPTMSSTTETRSQTNKSSEFFERERAETWNEVAALELEHTHWGRLFTTRCQEKASVKKALDRLMKIRRNLTAEKACTETKLLHIANEVPLAVATMRGINAATDVAVELSTNISTPDTLQPSQVSGAVTKLTSSLVTLAERTRGVFEREGWNALTLEEQQWITVDQSMCPDKYSWLRPQQQEETDRNKIKYAKVRTKPRKNPAIDQCRFHRDELVRILAEPFRELNRREKHVCKLMIKFYNDPRLTQNVGLRELSCHDECTLAQRIRNKNANELTVQEQEWVSLDKILHPQIWRRLLVGIPGSRNDLYPLRNSGELVHEGEKEQWQCPFSRDELLRIWSSCGNDSAATQDERRAHGLLTAFNGPYQAEKPTKAKRGWRSVQMEKTAGTLHLDVDKRIREIQLELDRVSHNNNPKMNSFALLVVPQRYPTSSLRLELERQLDLLLREQVQQRERKNNYIIEEYSSSEDETRDGSADEQDHQIQKADNRRARRLKRRESGADVNIFATRKRVLLDARKTVLQRENIKRVAQLGPGGCQACMTNPCSHIPVLDVEETNARLDKVTEELHFARMHTDTVIESTVPLSTEKDGKTTFRRIELIEELTSEQKKMRYMMKFHFIDLEFHEANQTTNEHMESVALHGYRTFLWTQHARVALKREHNRLVARLVAIEIVDNILDWMLEGWHFGERQSRYETLGYVPSIKKYGFIKPGVDTKTREEPSAEQDKILLEKEEDKASMFTLPPGIATSSWTKSTEHVVKPGGVHDAEIGFMERTMHFGVFCVTIMYFRAKWLLARQKEGVADFKRGWDIDTNVPVRAQRKTVTDLTVNSMQAGYQRVKVRKEKEQAEVLADFAGFLAVEKRELDATQLIQRMYRGHIGRKAAQRWIAKRAEYNATNSLMVSAAVTIQRLMRGYWGRNRAKTVRAGIARWLAHLFDDEEREFEAEVLRNDKLEALKRGIGALTEAADDESGSDVSVV